MAADRENENDDAGRAAPADDRSARARAGYWFPVLLAGVLTALWLPLAAVTTPGAGRGSAFFILSTFPPPTTVMYLGGLGKVPFLTPLPLGWYWVGMLAISPLLTAAWYRWREHRAIPRISLRGYLITGLILAVAVAALPLLAWGPPGGLDSALLRSRVEAVWQLGGAALLATAISLGVLARARRSRALAIITVIYLVVAALAGGWDIQEGVPGPLMAPYADPGVVLPALTLLAAGLGAALAAGFRRLRARA